MFRAVYDSPWHNPVLFLLAGVALIATLARRMPFLQAWAVLFAVEIMLDAAVTGNLTPLRADQLGTAAVPFVILGDLRFFLLVERYARVGSDRRAPVPRDAALATLAWSFIVPVGAFGTSRLLPQYFGNPRYLFLLYESAFIVLAVVYRAVVMPRLFARGRPRPEVARWLHRVALFELVQYTAWAAADVVILSGADIGFALRLVPNVMYYALFLPFVLWTAPPREVGA